MTITSSAFNSSLLVPVTEDSQVGDARRRAVELATRVGFDELRRGELAIVVTELATNLVKHAGSGGILICNALPASSQLEIIAVDNGPGIADLEIALTDGFSTAGSLGTGLGAVKRLAAWFDCYSHLGIGTVVAARLTAGRANVAVEEAIAGISVAKPGQVVCGDSWAAVKGEDLINIVVADGLGHGIEAAEASAAAVGSLQAGTAVSPADALSDIHRKLKSTRGAAVAIAQIKPVERRVSFCGLGNISAVLASATTRQAFVSHDGTAGYEAMRIRQYAHDFRMDSVMILSSDGCSTRWDLSAFPGLLDRSPAVICGALFRATFKGNDDATMVVVKL